ncbi:hypothetical protein ZHAS_00011238 [Anopheles sinensis]|uniref:Uncharacterized protein n=1 Tax=Anopheles sinensis TaxID=74873 RepID=A0A084VZN2_ANOSI|nr:hypothetical protein ZHAS_00011238 [Anopheles sinensis]
MPSSVCVSLGKASLPRGFSLKILLGLRINLRVCHFDVFVDRREHNTIIPLLDRTLELACLKCSQKNGQVAPCTFCPPPAGGRYIPLDLTLSRSAPVTMAALVGVWLLAARIRRGWFCHDPSLGTIDRSRSPPIDRPNKAPFGAATVQPVRRRSQRSIS